MSQINKVLLFAVVPALIAGLFSVAPKLYDIATEPKADLSYEITSSPDLETEGKHRRIFSVRIENTGKKPLSDISAVFKIDNGIIEKQKVYETSSLNPKVSESNSSLSVNISKLHPNEQFSISALIQSVTDNVAPIFNLRSSEALGKPKEVDSKIKSSNNFEFLGAVLAGLSVFLMTIVVSRKPALLLSVLSFNDKQDILFYITARLGLTSISSEMQFLGKNLSYLRMADILLAHGLVSEKDNKEKCIMALKCLILVKDIAERSKQVVINNLKTLEGEDYSDNEILLLSSKSASIDDAIAFRENIDKYIINSAAFLTFPVV